MSRLSVNFSEPDTQSRRGAGSGMGGSILFWVCFCALAYLALRFLGVNL